MGITLVLKLVSGDLNQGFTVLLQVRKDPEGLCLLERVGHLPADHQLEDLYQDWQTSFRHLIHQGRNGHDIDWGIDDIPSNICKSDSNFEACKNYISLLEDNMERWLRYCPDEGWQQVQQQIMFQLGKNSSDIRLVIQSDSKLWKLPWLAWNLLQLKSESGKKEIGIGFSPVEYQTLEAVTRGERKGSEVRILAVFGSGDNLDLEPDRMALQQLAHAEVETLNEPCGRELIKKLRDPQGWDIFCFSGHSQTKGRDGIIYINDTENLELRQFQEALKTAICQGLKLAIFNSCDGLGLAEKLAGLQLPVAIVMKEPVPDAVAQCFLKVFLREYAAGAPLYTAVRRSQTQLQEEFLRFPGCNSLPIICQNPAEVPPTWAELSHRKPIVPPPISPWISPIPREKSLTRRWQKLGRILATSFAIGLFVLSAQWHGKLQTFELYAFDHLMRLLPPEEMDRRLLIVGADTRDLRQYGYPLPDSILAEVIEKINQYHPAAIGLNIIRDRPVEENAEYPGGHQAFLTQLNSSQDNVVSVCSYSNQLETSTKPLPGILDSEHQVGFIDVYRDQELTQTQQVRRYILSRSNNAVPLETLCHTRFSLAIQLFERYLKYSHSPVDIETPDKNWKFGSLLIPSLDNRTGGYQNLKGYGQGSQILIRYRHTQNSNQIAPQIRLQDVLEETRLFKPDKISGKVVLIGVTDPIEEKLFLTPYGQVNQLSLHAHVVSQLISAFEDTVVGKNQRPLIWWWPQWVNMLWILGWSFLGGFLLWWFPHPIHQWMAMSSAILGLYGICWLFLIQGGWIPLVPALLTLIAPTLIWTFLTLSKIKSFE